MNDDVVRKRRQVVGFGFWKWVRIKAGERVMEWTVAVTEPAPALDLRCPKLQGSGQVSAIGFQRGSAAEALKRLPIFWEGKK